MSSFHQNINSAFDKLKSNQHHQLVLLILVFASLKLTLFNSINLGNADEGYYLNAVKVMRESGDYLIPKYYWGPERVNKPIGMYWLVLGSQLIFGDTLFAARLVTLLAAIGIVIFSFRMTIRLFPKNPHPIVTPLILISTFQFNKYVLDIIPEMTLVFFISLSHLLIWDIFKSESKDKKQSKNMVFLFASMGFGFMIKGPAAIILPMGTYFGYAVFTNRFQILKKLFNPWAILVLTVIILPWYIYLFSINEHIFFQLFDREITGRLGGEFLNIRKLEIPTYFLPWVLLIALKLKSIGKCIRQRSDATNFLLIWLLFSIGIIVILVKEYHAHYLLDIALPVSLALSALIYKADNRLILKWFTSVITAFLIARGIVHVIVFSLLSPIIEKLEIGILYSLCTLAMLLIALTIALRKRLKQLHYVYLISTCFVIAQLNHHHSIDQFNWKYPFGGLYSAISKTSNHSIVSSHKSFNNEITLTWSIVGDNVGGSLAQTQADLNSLLSGGNKNLTVKQAIIGEQTFEMLPKTIKNDWEILRTKYYVHGDFNNNSEMNLSSEKSFGRKFHLIMQYIKAGSPDILFYKYYLIKKKQN